MENNNNQTAADILNSAAWNLENNIIPWGKGAFYKFLSQDPENTECQMCAHGAIGYCGSDEVKKLIGKKAVTRAQASSSGRMGAASAVVEAAYYKNRILKGQYGEVGKANYLAWKVGLDYGFNDDPKTTKEMVVEKLREAASKYPEINSL